LKCEVTSADTETDANRFVRLGNVALVVGQLLSAKASLDQEYWRAKLLAFATDGNQNGVLQRKALFALEQLGDPSIVEQLPAALLEGDQSIAKAFLELCAAVNPESPVSLRHFVRATTRRQIEARDGFYALKGDLALRTFLETFNANALFRQAFLDQVSVFGDKDRILVDNITLAFDDDVARLCEEAVAVSFHDATAHDAQRSSFILGLGELLKSRDPHFVSRIIQRIRTTQPRPPLYYAEPLFAALIETPEEVDRFLTDMIAAHEQTTAFGVLVKLKFSTKHGAEELFEAGRARLAEEYRCWEKHQKTTEARASADQKRLLNDFREQLEPAPGQYNPGVFALYAGHASELERLLSPKERQRLKDLISGSVFKNVNPADYDLTVTREDRGGATTYTISSNVGLFRDALLAAQRLGMDVAPFRQIIINYIPFAWSEELQTIFGLVKNVTSTELAPVMSVYKNHKSDLCRHRPSSFIEAVERYHITDATPVLKTLVTEPALDTHVRQRALSVLESFAPDKEFLKGIVSAFQGGANGDKLLAEAAAGLLITNHADAEAIRERLRLVVEGAAPFTPPQGAHAVSGLEEEILGSKSFAKPLMEVRTPGYEQQYLSLLDHSMALWVKGKEFYEYAAYLWNIVYAYFDNLKESGSYGPLQLLEQKVAGIKDRQGANWLASRMVNLRRAYLSYLGKPQNFAEAVRLYNDEHGHSRKAIVNSQDLAQHLQEAIETDLTRWIEAEGAYEVLRTERLFKGNQQYEKLVQKTLKSQVENILFKRGFQVDVYREPQLLDEKRPDMLVRYGFAGPVVVEVKLTSNKDMRTIKPEQSASYTSMKRYLEGYGASHGIFLVIDNKPTKNLNTVIQAFAQIPNVWVRVFDCRKDSNNAKTGPRGHPKSTSQQRTSAGVSRKRQ
jgi:hypothetical protein